MCPSRRLHRCVTAQPLSRLRRSATDDGLMQMPHSKAHRLDLASFKLVAAEQRGESIARDLLPGDVVDAPVGLPMIWWARALVGRTGLAAPGDGRRAAVESRAETQARRDQELTPLRITGETKEDDGPSEHGTPPRGRTSGQAGNIESRIAAPIS